MKARGVYLGVAVCVALVLGIGACAAEREAIEKPREAAARAMNEFAVDLYGAIAQREGNLFLSPYSIHTALAMTSVGARGRTAEQMRSVLHLPPQGFVVHQATGGLMRQVERPGQREKTVLKIANALWGQQGEPFRERFLDRLRRWYRAPLQEVDFVAETEQAREAINQWAHDRTEGKIEDLVPRGALSAMTRLVLANAIYFKGLWQSPFEEDDTRERPFHLSEGEQVSVPTMYQKGRFAIAEGDGYRALELPYKGEELAMVILLPDARDGLTAVESGLDSEELSGTLGRFRQREVRVFLPRFRIESAFGLKSVLTSLGMEDAFVPEQADLSGINGRRNLFVSAVLHKAFVEVDEEGTEAAAATAVVVGVTSVAPQPPVFRADHPFLFLIRHRPTGLVLFAGRMADPRA
ncbi:MAG: serpin family protein [Candidatus Brocadiia bacterium]